MKNSDYVKACGNCSHSIYLFPSNQCYCDIKGPVDEMDKCGKYYFDPLKHKPSSPVTFNSNNSDNSEDCENI